MIDRYLSFSQIKYYHECPRRWGYKYADGYKPKQPPGQFMRGSLIHFGMESGLRARHGGGGILLPWWPRAELWWRQEWEKPGDELFLAPNFFADAKRVVEGA